MAIAVVSTLFYRRQSEDAPCRYAVGPDAVVCDARANLTLLLSVANATRRSHSRRFKRFEIVGVADEDCQLTLPTDGRLTFEEVSIEELFFPKRLPSNNSKIHVVACRCFRIRDFFSN